MCDRQNTIVCIFDLKSPRITAYHIHEWIYEALYLQEEDIRMIQIDRPQRKMCIKFVINDKMITTLQRTKGLMQYHHENGELSHVKVEVAGLGIKRLRIANLPPEYPDLNIRDLLAKYGKIKRISEDQ